MTDASSDSDESGGRTQDWEVVSLSTLSMSGSGAGLCPCDACAAAAQDGGSGRSSGLDEGGPHPNLFSNHFGSAGEHVPNPMLDQFLGSECESRTGVENHQKDGPTEDSVPMASNSNEAPAADIDVKVSQQTAASDGKLEEKEGSSAETLLPEMDWIEPVAPDTNDLMREESDDVGSNNNMVYDMACDKKPASESDRGQSTGPLLGSSMSAPSNIATVNTVGPCRSGSGEEIVPSSIGGEECSMTSNCAVDDELAGIEREILGADSGFDSFHEEPVVKPKKIVYDDENSDLTNTMLDEEERSVDHISCEAWWKRRAALWFVEARQANTFWSLALAAAVMGLVILGQRWQHERYQNHHLRLQLCSKDEKISQLIFQVARLKDALSGRRRVPVLRTSATYSSFRDRF